MVGAGGLAPDEGGHDHGPGYPHREPRHSSTTDRNEKASEADLQPLRWHCRDATPRLFKQQSTLCSYPVHRSLPPTRRCNTDGDIVPKEAWCKQPPRLSGGGRGPRGDKTAQHSDREGF